MIKIEDKEYRNLQEQVAYNAERIEDLEKQIKPKTYHYSLTFSDVNDEEWEFLTDFYSTNDNLIATNLEELKSLIYNVIGNKFRVANVRSLIGFYEDAVNDSTTIAMANVSLINDVLGLSINGTSISSVSHVVLNKKEI